MALIRWQPPNEVFDLSRVLDSFWGAPTSGKRFQTAWAPSVDVSETDEEIVVSAELPGLKPEEVSVTVADGSLTIAGEKKRESETEEKHLRRVERSYGAFTRSFQLPGLVEAGAISASYGDGVLNVTLPKAENARTKQIAVIAS